MAGLAGLIGTALLLVTRSTQETTETPVQKINALLPQTQCAQCNYPGCLLYAKAIADGTADIDQCAPGGDATVTALANLLGRSTRKVNPVYGKPQPLSVAVINEAACIGCVLCIDICPVDAIVGASRYTHTVIQKECTGCELCIPLCPVDCIEIVPLHREHIP
ncbi:MAG: RnfABCDGE type electron transport complex subunit B [Gammaproteobacteria bacterium]|nr:RnfABCDGE type electron transport complex subunit B [Gammaproteobacteria bacterium]